MAGVSHSHWDGCSQVAESLIGCNLPLTDVAQQLLQIYLDSSPETSVSGIAIRNCIVELASRRSFAPGSESISFQLCMATVTSMTCTAADTA